MTSTSLYNSGLSQHPYTTCSIIRHSSPVGEWNILWWRVCVSVCLSVCLSVILAKFLVHVSYGRGSAVARNGVDIDGVKTRSRVILVHGTGCPDQLVENRRCSPGGDCPHYSWNTSAWLGNRRRVWCHDHDGRVVYGT